MKKVRILSIDGGGIRGILPGVILAQLEAKLQNKTKNPEIRLSDMFDFMAGTSTGGILTLSYLTPDETGEKSKFTAQEAVNLYLERGDEIFDISLKQKIKSGMGITDEKYNAKELEEALDDNFKDVNFNQLLKPCVITSYNIRKGEPHFFSQHKSNNIIHNFKVKDIARATSAAPTYFETARIKNEFGSPFILVDGGVFANNPALVAYSEVRTMEFNGIKPKAENMMIVSIGTGSKSKQYSYNEAKDWGAVGWIKPVIDIMMSGNAQTVNHHLVQIYDTLSPKNKLDYYRLEPELINADSEMDNASPTNLKNLELDAKTFVSNDDIDKELDIIVDKLIEYGKE